MKINRTRSIAKKNMRKAGNTSDRPEQLLAAKLIDIQSPAYVTVETEVKVDVKKISETLMHPTVDILVKYAGHRIVVRLNGPYHDELKQSRHDYIERIFLEKQIPKYMVVDFGHAEMHALFLRNKRKLSKLEIITAYAEIYGRLQQLFPLKTLLRDDAWEHLKDHLRKQNDQVS